MNDGDELRQKIIELMIVFIPFCAFRIAVETRVGLSLFFFYLRGLVIIVSSNEINGKFFKAAAIAGLKCGTLFLEMGQRKSASFRDLFKKIDP